jgi:hypothetical protein
LETVDQFFIFLVYVTSGCTFKSITRALNVAYSTVARCICNCVQNIGRPPEAFMPRVLPDIDCQEQFQSFPGVFAIVDASPMFIRRPKRNQDYYYSGKYRRHCVKVQALVTPVGQCIHCSSVYQGTTHDKAIFDRSGIGDFIAYEGNHWMH